MSRASRALDYPTSPEQLSHAEYRRFATGYAVDAESGCWLWQHGTTAGGYPNIHVGGRTLSVHRLAYTLAHGSVDAGLDIDHLCRVRRCVNPDHLEAVTHGENVSRGWRAQGKGLDKRTGPSPKVVRLADRDAAVLELICAEVAASGVSPTAREIGRALGLSSTSQVHAALQRLTRANRLRNAGHRGYIPVDTFGCRVRFVRAALCLAIVAGTVGAVSTLGALG